MSGVLIAKQNETISISAPDIYGANFKLSIFSQKNNNWILSNQEMLEYIEEVEEYSTNISNNFLKEDIIIEVEDASFFDISDIIKINSFYYRITKIESNLLTLHTSLKEDIPESSPVERVGNLSLYYLIVNIEEPGDYIIKAKDSIFGISITDSIKVVPKSIDTLANDIKNLEYAILGM